MKGKHLNSGKSQISKRGVEEVGATRVTLGDLIWVGLNGGSWWPAQAVDDNTIGESIKPGNKSAGKVLVRLYGSYKYLYVDPVKSHSEFKRILEQNNGCYWKIFKKALEQDRLRSKFGRSKRQGSKSKGGLHKKLKPKHTGTEKGRSKIPEQDEMEKKVKPNNRSTQKESKIRTPKQDEGLNKNKLNSPSFETTLFGKSPELSARRMKVMQSLGLIAPSGSPFHKNGHVYLRLC